MVKHNGGKADVDAIGDRNVGCKTGLGNWYGVEKQVALRKQYARQLEATRDHGVVNRGPEYWPTRRRFR